MEQTSSELARHEDIARFRKIINMLNLLLDRIEKKDYKIISGLCYEIYKMKMDDRNIDGELLYNAIYKHIRSPKWYFFWMPYHKSFKYRVFFWKIGLKKPRVRYVKWLIKYYNQKLKQI